MSTTNTRIAAVAAICVSLIFSLHAMASSKTAALVPCQLSARPNGAHANAASNCTPTRQPVGPPGTPVPPPTGEPTSKPFPPCPEGPPRKTCGPPRQLFDYSGIVYGPDARAIADEAVTVMTGDGASYRTMTDSRGRFHVVARHVRMAQSAQVLAAGMYANVRLTTGTPHIYLLRRKHC